MARAFRHGRGFLAVVFLWVARMLLRGASTLDPNFEVPVASPAPLSPSRGPGLSPPAGKPSEAESIEGSGNEVPLHAPGTEPGPTLVFSADYSEVESDDSGDEESSEPENEETASERMSKQETPVSPDPSNGAATVVSDPSVRTPAVEIREQSSVLVSHYSPVKLPPRRKFKTKTEELRYAFTSKSSLPSYRDPVPSLPVAASTAIVSSVDLVVSPIFVTAFVTPELHVPLQQVSPPPSALSSPGASVSAASGSLLSAPGSSAPVVSTESQDVLSVAASVALPESPVQSPSDLPPPVAPVAMESVVSPTTSPSALPALGSPTLHANPAVHASPSDVAAVEPLVPASATWSSVQSPAVYASVASPAQSPSPACVSSVSFSLAVSVPETDSNRPGHPSQQLAPSSPVALGRLPAGSSAAVLPAPSSSLAVLSQPVLPALPPLPSTQMSDAPIVDADVSMVLDSSPVSPSLDLPLASGPSAQAGEPGEEPDVDMEMQDNHGAPPSTPLPVQTDVPAVADAVMLDNVLPFVPPTPEVPSPMSTGSVAWTPCPSPQGVGAAPAVDTEVSVQDAPLAPVPAPSPDRETDQVAVPAVDVELEMGSDKPLPLPATPVSTSLSPAPSSSSRSRSLVASPSIGDIPASLLLSCTPRKGYVITGLPAKPAPVLVPEAEPETPPRRKAVSWLEVDDFTQKESWFRRPSAIPFELLEDQLIELEATMDFAASLAKDQWDEHQVLIDEELARLAADKQWREDEERERKKEDFKAMQRKRDEASFRSIMARRQKGPSLFNRPKKGPAHH
ncbi:hypothetical protein F5Y15DRAFT_415245 [Xylariaceae sp. FL0016]|nr:hypothetical protein F5Y15DRAFT_415245 [Xylariaceae sp. FL0016]